jgi:hypothetical protein
VPGASAVIKASSVPELETRVAEWYENAAADGLGVPRIPWDPTKVREIENGYEFSVLAHTLSAR